MDAVPSESIRIVPDDNDAYENQALSTSYLRAKTRPLHDRLGQAESDSCMNWEQYVVFSATDCPIPGESSSDTILEPSNQVSSVCARLIKIFRNLEKYTKFLRYRDEAAKDLLDLLQKLLDHALIDSRFRIILYVALVRLCRKSELYPRCFSLTDISVDPTNPLFRGGFGDIYQGQYNGRAVCIKAVQLYQQSNRSALEKAYSREAVVWGQLLHPNILPFYGIHYLENPRKMCLVSPWMSNGDIRQFLRDPARSQLNRTPLISDVASGMEYLHKNGVVHGDLKSMNVLVTESERACLADFGLSYITESGGLTGIDLTSNQAEGGTPGFEAPELADLDVIKRTNASDVFAFAVVCFEMFTGELPFGKSVIAAYNNVRKGARPKRPINHVHMQRGLSDGMWALMQRCWSQLPEDRPTATEILQALSLLSTVSQPESWGEYARTPTPGFGMESEGQLDATIASALTHLQPILSG